MIKFFRKIRQNLLMENKTGKYFKYAIGEIVLVVIGILLALQINTWNNNQIAKKQLKETYEQIQTDLKADTTNIAQIVKLYDEKDKRIQNIIDRKIKSSFYDTINSLNYKDCKICITESTNFVEIKPITKGYGLLKNIIAVIGNTSDSLPDKIEQFYTNGPPILESDIQSLKNITFKNVETHQQYSWFVDWAEKKYNKEFLSYIFESQEYRNQLARYRIMYKRNYIRNLKYYRELSIEILDLIEMELNKK
ncbi:hypothetical protein GCM10010976_17630 [Bizionia arctica]|uniref:Uncharacterized protein n=2 Tax=Bizionia arctica TaxID=1495645 RepID=A0A917GIF3_9FLAO|nr:hypothetical protein GCM10010976_17630 [Bizionia arctica]